MQYAGSQSVKVSGESNQCGSGIQHIEDAVVINRSD